MNYRTHGHTHRLQIISPPVGGLTNKPRGIIDFHCHACGTTIQVYRLAYHHKPHEYRIINTF
jgi:hypothetical protein